VREALQLTGVDGDRVPEANVVFDRELIELVCDAAAALPRDEYSLLALHVRHDLPADVIGDQLGLNGAVSARLARAREAFDDAVLCQLVARRGRHNCEELDMVVREHEPRRVAQHVQHCVRCRESNCGYVSPAEVLGALQLVEPAAELRREIFGATRRRRVFGIL
jgi:hypothetical protein